MRQWPRSLTGMWLAHLGVAVFAFGVSMVRTYEVEEDLTMAIGSSATVGGYEFRFADLHELHGPNYEAIEGDMPVTRNGSEVTVLHPQKRIYRVQRTPTTEAAIQPGLTRDLYVSLGEIRAAQHLDAAGARQALRRLDLGRLPADGARRHRRGQRPALSPEARAPGARRRRGAAAQPADAGGGGPAGCQRGVAA
jgi:hypothetical protein